MEWRNGVQSSGFVRSVVRSSRRVAQPNKGRVASTGALGSVCCASGLPCGSVQPVPSSHPSPRVSVSVAFPTSEVWNFPLVTTPGFPVASRILLPPSRSCVQSLGLSEFSARWRRQRSVVSSKTRTMANPVCTHLLWIHAHGGLRLLSNLVHGFFPQICGQPPLQQSGARAVRLERCWTRTLLRTRLHSVRVGRLRLSHLGSGQIPWVSEAHSRSQKDQRISNLCSHERFGSKPFSFNAQR